MKSLPYFYVLLNEGQTVKVWIVDELFERDQGPPTLGNSVARKIYWHDVTDFLRCHMDQNGSKFLNLCGLVEGPVLLTLDRFADWMSSQVSYVDALYQDYLKSPKLISCEWQRHFRRTSAKIQSKVPNLRVSFD